MVCQLPAGIPRFCFQDAVFTHQDIAPRNLILDEKIRLWIVDRGCARVYPRGFEQAALREQPRHVEFTDMVMISLSDQLKDMAGVGGFK